MTEGVEMQVSRRSASLLSAALLLVGCTGKGVDAPLATTDETTYRASLNKAWPDMSAQQQQAFNWAVSNFNLHQLSAKYSSMTPRSVISREADEYIQLKTQQAAKSAADLAANAESLAQQEKALKGVEAELSKVSARGLAIQNKFGFGKDFVFEVNNASNFNLSSAQWDAWMFLNGEETSTRHCRVYSSFKYNGGLRAGASMRNNYEIGFMTCDNWNTLEVQNAKSKQYQLKLDLASAKNFDERSILPVISPSRADYEKAIADAGKEIEDAKMHKESLK